MCALSIYRYVINCSIFSTVKLREENKDIVSYLILSNYELFTQYVQIRQKRTRYQIYVKLKRRGSIQIRIGRCCIALLNIEHAKSRIAKSPLFFSLGNTTPKQNSSYNESNSSCKCLGLLLLDTKELLAWVRDARRHLLGVLGAELRHVHQGHG